MATKKVDWGSRTAKRSAGTDVVLDDGLDIPASRSVLWARIGDIPFVASCLPGVVPESLQEISATEYRALMLQSVMGYDSKWDLHATIEPAPDDHRLTVTFDGADARLGMTLEGTATLAVLEQGPEAARVDYKAKLRVNGSLAALGGPIIRSTIADAISSFVAGVGGAEPPATAPTRFALLRAWLSDLWKQVTRKTGS